MIDELIKIQCGISIYCLSLCVGVVVFTLIYNLSIIYLQYAACFLISCYVIMLSLAGIKASIISYKEYQYNKLQMKRMIN